MHQTKAPLTATENLLNCFCITPLSYSINLLVSSWTTMVLPESNSSSSSTPCHVIDGRPYEVTLWEGSTEPIPIRLDLKALMSLAARFRSRVNRLLRFHPIIEIKESYQCRRCTVLESHPSTTCGAKRQARQVSSHDRCQLTDAACAGQRTSPAVLAGLAAAQATGAPRHTTVPTPGK